MRGRAVEIVVLRSQILVESRQPHARIFRPTLGILFEIAGPGAAETQRTGRVLLKHARAAKVDLKLRETEGYSWLDDVFSNHGAKEFPLSFELLEAVNQGDAIDVQGTVEVYGAPLAEVIITDVESIGPRTDPELQAVGIQVEAVEVDDMASRLRIKGRLERIQKLSKRQEWSGIDIELDDRFVSKVDLETIECEVTIADMHDLVIKIAAPPFKVPFTCRAKVP